MGWLRDLMAEAKPSIQSYGLLARAALAHPDWAGPKPQPRSLAALWSKLDRGQELDWLADRPVVQRILSDVLGAPPAIIDQVVGAAVDAADDLTRHLRLRDAPYARPLDLLHERLPPGIPEIVSRPPRWYRLFWRAPSGAGRTLVGRWLEARGLATYIEASGWSDAYRSLPASGPVFLELRSAEGVEPLLDRPPVDQLCVAAPFCPDESTLGAASWTKLASPATREYLADFVEWFGQRLPADGHWQADRALAWLRRVTEHETLDTLGALIGLSGLFDELGAKRVERSRLEDIARRWIERRLARADPAETWAERDGYSSALGLVRNVLSDSEEPWDAPRSVDEWVRLVPHEFQRSVDAEWIRLSVSKSTSTVTKRELERALKDLPPGGFRVVRTLQKAGLLSPSGDGESLTLSPRWLAGVLATHAQRDLVNGSAFEWGEALLRPHATRAMFAGVRRRFERGELADDVLDFDEQDNPAYVAALEASFRGAGLSLLEGAEIPVEYLESLWDAQMEIVVDLGDLPFPRIVYTDRDVGADLRVGAWCLAGLAISEQLPAHRGRRHRLLRPWLLPKPAPALVAVLDAIHAAVSECTGDARWALAAYELATRLDEALGTESPEHALNAPSRLLAAFTAGNVKFAHTESMDAPAWAALPALAETRGLDVSDVFRAIWRAWSDASEPPSVIFERTMPAANALWAAMPSDVLEQALVKKRFGPNDIPYSLLDEAQCTAVLAASRAAAFSCEMLWSLAPDSFVQGALASRLVDEHAAHVLWYRSPHAVLESVDREIERDPRWVCETLNHAPARHTTECVARLRRLSSSGALDADWARPWLYARVRDRTPGWREAYALLSEIERKAE